jgi:hypothetical protein
LDDLEAGFDARARIEKVTQGISDEIEALCGRERSGPAAEIPSDARDLISQTRFDPRPWIQIVTQGISDEIE